MNATTVAELIAHLQRTYKADDILLNLIIEKEDYTQIVIGDEPTEWAEAAHTLSAKSDWLYPEIHGWIAQEMNGEH